MRPSLLAFMLVVLSGFASGQGIGAAHAGTPEATPVTAPDVGAKTFVVVEHNDHETVIDLGAPGPSAGDLLIWGPNPLYDEANARDTGATSQGTCISLHAPNACLLNETVVFADGSTLHLQGIELSGGAPSTRTIVGGSGRYLAATGTLHVTPTEDERLWTKTFELVAP